MREDGVALGLEVLGQALPLQLGHGLLEVLARPVGLVDQHHDRGAGAELRGVERGRQRRAVERVELEGVVERVARGRLALRPGVAARGLGQRVGRLGPRLLERSPALVADPAAVLLRLRLGHHHADRGQHQRDGRQGLPHPPATPVPHRSATPRHESNPLPHPRDRPTHSS